MEKICIVGNDIYAKFTQAIPKVEYNIKPCYTKEHSLISDHKGELVSIIPLSLYEVYFDGFTLIIDIRFTKQRINVKIPFILSIDGVEYRISSIANTAKEWVDLKGLLIDLCRFNLNRPLYSKDIIEEPKSSVKNKTKPYNRAEAILKAMVKK